MNERKCEPAGNRGAILPMFALCVMLLAIFAISFSIDIPLTNTTATRLQNALDTGAMECLNSLIAENSNATAATKGRANAAAVLGDTYSPDSVSYKSFTEGSGGFDSLIVAIPQREGSTYEPLYAYDGTTSGTSLDTRPQNVFDEIFDPGSIDDYKNACMAYGKFSQKRYFSSLLGPQTAYAGGFHDTFIELASVAMIKPIMNYILFNTSISLQTGNESQNINYIFGTAQGDDGTTDSLMWPIARHDAAGHLVEDDFGWSWPSPDNTGLFNNHPFYNYSIEDTGGTGGTNDVAHHLIELCSSLPWYYVKTSVVNLIDRFTQSSAFSQTTMVGITIPKQVENLELIPVHPKTLGPDGYIIHDTSVPFPPLSTHYSTHFEGWMDSSRLPMYGRSGNTVPTGWRAWGYCWCRGLYVDVATGTDYLMAEDLYGNDDDPDINHVDPSTRRRGSGSSTNWCDDNPTGNFEWTPSARPWYFPLAHTIETDIVDTTVDFTYAQSGSGASGETPRNIISQLGMMHIALGHHEIEAFEDNAGGGTYKANTWNRFTPSPYIEMDTSRGTLAPSISAACSNLSTAQSNWEADASLQDRRPLGTPTLFVVGFGIWSAKKRDSDVALGTYPTNAAAEAAYESAFESAIRDCVCTKGIRVEMALVPLNSYHLWTVAQVQDVFTGFSDVATHYFSDSGVAIPAGYEACDATDPVSKNNLFIYDWHNSRYNGYATESAKKLAATKDVYNLVPELFHRLAIEIDSAI